MTFCRSFKYLGLMTESSGLHQLWDALFLQLYNPQPVRPLYRIISTLCLQHFLADVQLPQDLHPPMISTLLGSPPSWALLSQLQAMVSRTSFAQTLSLTHIAWYHRLSETLALPSPHSYIFHANSYYQLILETTEEESLPSRIPMLRQYNFIQH